MLTDHGLRISMFIEVSHTNDRFTLSGHTLFSHTRASFITDLDCLQGCPILIGSEQFLSVQPMPATSILAIAYYSVRYANEINNRARHPLLFTAG